MKRLITFTVATVLAIVLSTTAWSQAGGSGGAGGSGTAGTSGSSGTAGTAGAAGTTGAAGTASSVGTTGTTGVGAVGTTGTGAVGTTGVGATTGSRGVGTGVQGAAGANPGVGQRRAAVNGRANANAGLNNANARVNLMNQGFVNQTPFFSDPGARRQLNLNNNQFSTLNTAYQNAYARYNQALSNLNPNLNEEQRMMEMQRLQAQFNQDLSGSVSTTVTDPQMRSRFNQLNRQFMGFNAFNDPSVRQQLNLTPQQVRQLRTLSNNWRQQLQQFRRGAGNDLSSVDTAQWNQLWQQYGTQLNGVLTPEQQQMWAQQVGQPVTFSPTTVFGTQELGDGVTDATPFGQLPQTVVNKNQQPGAAGATTPQGVGQPTTQGTVPQQTVLPKTATQGTSTGTATQGTATQR